jgi:hypothetical protein
MAEHSKMGRAIALPHIAGYAHIGGASYVAIDRRQPTRGQLARGPAARQPCRVMRVAVLSDMEYYRQITRLSGPARVSQIVLRR